MHHSKISVSKAPSISSMVRLQVEEILVHKYTKMNEWKFLLLKLLKSILTEIWWDHDLNEKVLCTSVEIKVHVLYGQSYNFKQ